MEEQTHGGNLRVLHVAKTRHRIPLVCVSEAYTL